MKYGQPRAAILHETFAEVSTLNFSRGEAKPWTILLPWPSSLPPRARSGFRKYGSGNVNDTFRVTLRGGAETALYPATPQHPRVPPPELIMGNLSVVSDAHGPAAERGRPSGTAAVLRAPGAAPERAGTTGSTPMGRSGAP